MFANIQKQGGAGSMPKENEMVRPGKEKGLQIVVDRNFDRWYHLMQPAKLIMIQEETDLT